MISNIQLFFCICHETNINKAQGQQAAGPGTDGYITAGSYHEAVSGSKVGSIYHTVLYSMKILSLHIRATFGYSYASANCRCPKRMAGHEVVFWGSSVLGSCV